MKEIGAGLNSAFGSGFAGLGYMATVCAMLVCMHATPLLLREALRSAPCGSQVGRRLFYPRKKQPFSVVGNTCPAGGQVEKPRQLQLTRGRRAGSRRLVVRRTGAVGGIEIMTTFQMSQRYFASGPDDHSSDAHLLMPICSWMPVWLGGVKAFSSPVCLAPRGHIDPRHAGRLGGPEAVLAVLENQA